MDRIEELLKEFEQLVDPNSIFYKPVDPTAKQRLIIAYAEKYPLSDEDKDKACLDFNVHPTHANFTISNDPVDLSYPGSFRSNLGERVFWNKIHGDTCILREVREEFPEEVLAYLREQGRRNEHIRLAIGLRGHEILYELCDLICETEKKNEAITKLLKPKILVNMIWYIRVNYPVLDQCLILVSKHKDQ